MPEKPHNFWQELKRRKVIRVIIGYAAASYVILELISIIAEPFGLPDWTLRLVFVLLCVGFIIAVVLSWIYDFTPRGIEKTRSAKVTKEKEDVSEPAKRKLRVSDIIIAVLLVAVIILIYPKIFKSDKLEQLRSEDRITVAVMPFQNMTGDTTWNIWREGIQNELITSLTNTEELKVRQTETINNLLQGKDPLNYASLTPSAASNISQQLEANIFIYGTIKQAGGTIRINARLVDSKTEEIFRSFEINARAREEMIFKVIDSLKKNVRDFLIINKLISERPLDYTYYEHSNSPDAYRYFIYGIRHFAQREYPAARQWFEQALEADSHYIPAAIYTSTSYANQGLYEEAKNWYLRIYRNRDLMPIHQKIITDWLKAWYFETPVEEVKHLKKILEIDEQSLIYQYVLGACYNQLNQYYKAITELKKPLELYEEAGSKPPWIYNYTALGLAYHETGKYRKERKLYKKAERDFPGDPELLFRQSVLALSMEKTRETDEYIELYISALDERSYSEADIASSLGNMYKEAGLPEKAVKYYREALSLLPESAVGMNNLAYILIDNNLNIQEGMELVEKALESRPDHFAYLHTKGWGLCKQGKFQEALEVLEKSWRLKPVYDHKLYLHLEAAKEAVAGQKREQ